MGFEALDYISIHLPSTKFVQQMEANSKELNVQHQHGNSGSV